MADQIGNGWSRRALLQGGIAGLPFLTANAQGQQAARPVIATRRMNNVMIAVSDLGRSLTLYQKLFGAALMQGDIAIFRVGDGPHFFGLTQAAAGEKPGFRSYCLSVDNFDPGQTAKALSGLAEAQVTMRGGTPELFLRDPNGIRLQLQHPAYGRGSGPRGDILPPMPRAAQNPAFALRGLNHVTLTVTDGPKSLAFYQAVFGLPITARQGPTVSRRIGPGPESVVFNAAIENPGGVAEINHACFTIENFDPGRAMGLLADNGFEPIEAGNPVKPLTCRVRLRQRAAGGGGPTSPLGTAELYLTDQDNIAIQIQDVRYCGGSGWLGEICS